MSAASCLDEGAEHGGVLAGGVKREGPLLPAMPRRVRLRRKTPSCRIIQDDSQLGSQSPGGLDLSGLLADPAAGAASSADIGLDRSESRAVARKTFARYKRWALTQIVSSWPADRRCRPHTPAGQALVASVWQTKYQPGGESGEWREHMQRWRRAPAPRPSLLPDADTAREEADILESRVDARAQLGTEGRRGPRLHSALCTYNGAWGKITDWSVPERLLDEVSVLRQEQTAQERQDIAVTTMCEELVTHSAQLSRLWAALRDRMPQRLQAMSIFQWACSLELCPHTFLESRVLRVHVHLFVNFGLQKRQVKNLEKELMLFGSRPRISSSSGGHVLQARNSGPNAGMYYLQCPKLGMLHHMGSMMPFTGYLVNGEWIMNLVQGGKMSATKARGEIIRTAKRLDAMLANLDRWVRETRTAHLRVLEEALRHDMSRKARPFRTLEPVAQWLQQFTVAKQRYKFLVLDGLSGMGKTQFAHSLASKPGAALDINMATASEPDLRDYRPQIHEVLIMDEITPEKVLAQKKLFQAGPTEVGLAASATSCHAYKVWVWRRRFVCCSNIWRQRLRQLCSEDQEWINANSVLVEVLEPLWVSDA